MDDKDKGPNKGDILQGAVGWTRDLMWMLHLKIQQQEELVNTIQELGGHVPFEMTEDEKRMQTELMEVMSAMARRGLRLAKKSGDQAAFKASWVPQRARARLRSGLGGDQATRLAETAISA